MKKHTLGALGLSLLLSQLAGCFIVVDDGDTSGQFAVAWSFSYGGTAQNATQACADLGVNKFDLRTVDQANGQVQYFRYDCNDGSVVTDPAILEGQYAVSVELRFDNDSDPTNGPAPLFGPIAPANNSVCTNGICTIYGGDVSNIGQFIFDIPVSTLNFNGRFDNSSLTLTRNCGGIQTESALVSTQIVNFSEGGQSIQVPLLGLTGSAVDPLTGRSNACQERNVTLGVQAVLFPATYNIDLIGRNTDGQNCYRGGVEVDILDLTGGTRNIGTIVSTYDQAVGCLLPKR